MHARHALPALAAAILACAPAIAAPRYAATLTRTAEGVAHVSARDMAGLGYGSGYAAAEDNGCIIADTLLTVRGERSRWFGARGRVTVGFNDIPNLESDFFHRAIGDLPALEKAFRATSRDNRAMLDGFAAGYSRFLRDHPERLAADCRGAAWVRPMNHADMLLLVGAAMVQGSASPYARFIAGAAPAAAPAGPLPAGQPGLGSNGWAFGSAVTANGKGILVGNPHFPWVGPNRFRRLHLSIPGKLDVAGAALTASPFVSIGFNRDVAWTHTVSTSQHMTLYQLRLDPADPTAYLVDGRREAMERRAVTVEVRDGPAVVRTLYRTRYGPMIAVPSAGLPWNTIVAFALRDANHANYRSGDAWLGFARARTVEQIRDTAARTLGIPYVNTLAADRAGHALFADISAIPNVSAAKLDACGTGQATKTGSDVPAIFILSGEHGVCRWTLDRQSPVPGLMPARQLPVLIRTDYLQNANDSYWLSSPANPMPAFAPILGPYGTRQGMRTRSAIAVLEAAVRGGKLDFDRVRALVLENRVEAALIALDDLLALCPQRPALAPACAALAAWDRHAESGSKGALLFFAFWRKAMALKDPWAVPFDPANPAITPRGLNRAQASAILDALQAAVVELTQLRIPLDAPLGAWQGSPHGGERIAIHGGPSSAGVLNAMHSAAAPGVDGLVPYHGTSYTQVVSFDAAGPVADTLLAYSQSSNPESPHASDGTRAYSEKRWQRLPFTPAQIAAVRIGEPLTIGE